MWALKAFTQAALQIKTFLAESYWTKIYLETYEKSPFENVEAFFSNTANVCLLKMTRVKDIKGTSSRQVQKNGPQRTFDKLSC